MDFLAIDFSQFLIEKIIPNFILISTFCFLCSLFGHFRVVDTHMKGSFMANANHVAEYQPWERNHDSEQQSHILRTKKSEVMLRFDEDRFLFLGNPGVLYY